MYDLDKCNVDLIPKWQSSDGEDDDGKMMMGRWWWEDDDGKMMMGGWWDDGGVNGPSLILFVNAYIAKGVKGCTDRAGY